MLLHPSRSDLHSTLYNTFNTRHVRLSTLDSHWSGPALPLQRYISAGLTHIPCPLTRFSVLAIITIHPLIEARLFFFGWDRSTHPRLMVEGQRALRFRQASSLAATHGKNYICFTFAVTYKLLPICEALPPCPTVKILLI